MTNSNEAGLTDAERRCGFVTASEGIIYTLDRSNRIIRMVAPDGTISYKRQMYGRWAWDKQKTTDPTWHPYSGTFYLTPQQAVDNAGKEVEDVKIMPCETND